jgi:hypothetical protein
MGHANSIRARSTWLVERFGAHYRPNDAHSGAPDGVLFQLCD